MDLNKKQLPEYQKGDELGGYKIAAIVGRNDDLMVCTLDISKGLGVSWRTRETYKFSDEQRTHIGAFNDRYDLVKRLFPGDGGQIESLALALYQGLSSPQRDPLSVFRAIDTRIGAAREDASSRTRSVYGVSAAVTTVVLWPLLLWIASLNSSTGGLFGDISASSLLVCATFGSLGALSSVLQKLRQVEVSYYPGFLTAAFGGSSRILLGSIFGAVAFLGAKAGLVLQTLLGVSGGDLLIGFAAGVSERLVPELIASIESKSVVEDKARHAKRAVG